ncbi:hypothetical protein MJO28_008001 [Puccinia striiformis f. sp. tritici]|uniref:Uncharacterized protein n=2 Tax=Puccinia striiformis TaxID=27350 RepID=A0A2S4UJ47_9BASI|nr:hypothetical protein MJO28_008001 [Puccinia striiformis f. sp. tritici]POV97338.1 hypothetical protein PSHT_14637 [Puccinia striiformis]
MSESPRAIITNASQQAHMSWVWGHFVKIGDKVQCILCKPGSNEPCDKKLSRNTKSSSTKSMLSHLLQKHQLMDPKKYEGAARQIENALKRQKIEGVGFKGRAIPEIVEIESQELCAELEKREVSTSVIKRPWIDNHNQAALQRRITDNTSALAENSELAQDSALAVVGLLWDKWLYLVKVPLRGK